MLLQASGLLPALNFDPYCQQLFHLGQVISFLCASVSSSIPRDLKLAPPSWEPGESTKHTTEFDACKELKKRASFRKYSF